MLGGSFEFSGLISFMVDVMNAEADATPLLSLNATTSEALRNIMRLVGENIGVSDGRPVKTQIMVLICLFTAVIFTIVGFINEGSLGEEDHQPPHFRTQ